MKNEIEKIREAMEQDFVSARVCPDSCTIELSPCGGYQLEVNEYSTVDFPHYATIAVATVQRTATGELVATIKRNDTRLFYAWVKRAGHDYLLFPEDLEGQTVINLTAQRIASFSSPDLGFIWVEFHLSIDQRSLAIIGCYWACPYQVTVYDFRSPLNLPLPIIAQFELSGEEHFSEWLSPNTFSLLNDKGAVRVCVIPCLNAD